MKVILSKDVAGIGRKGQVKEVSDGHARNFLIPRHLALPATSSMLAKVQKEEAEHEDKVKRQQAYMREVQKKLDGKTVTVTGKADGNNLFAAIKPALIIDAINKAFNLAIEEKQVIISQAIKKLGETEIQVRISEQEHAKLKVKVEKAE